LRASRNSSFRRADKSITTEVTGGAGEDNGEFSGMIPLQDSLAGVTFAIKVQPRAKKNGIVGILGDVLKVSLTAPPVDNKANEACIEFFAKLLKVSRSSVTIAAGQTSRNKVIRVVGLPAKEVESRLSLGSPS
jgi:uncharacterized protein